MKITDSPSPNFTERRDGKKPKYLILHYTGSENAEKALFLLQGGKKDHPVSAHYMVDEDGTVHRIVDENMRAWHAGKSYWEGEEDLNSTSIGIEIQNPGHEFGYRPFPRQQIAAVAELCKSIIARHNILPHNILAHSDIAPERKEDPGELFPWEELAKQGIGVWPKTTPADKTGEGLRAILTAYGYDPRIEDKFLVTAFQRRFEPKHLGTETPNTVQIARALLRQKNGN